MGIMVDNRLALLGEWIGADHLTLEGSQPAPAVGCYLLGLQG